MYLIFCLIFSFFATPAVSQFLSVCNQSNFNDFDIEDNDSPKFLKDFTKTEKGEKGYSGSIGLQGEKGESGEFDSTELFETMKLFNQSRPKPKCLVFAIWYKHIFSVHKDK